MMVLMIELRHLAAITLMLERTALKNGGPASAVEISRKDGRLSFSLRCMNGGVIEAVQGR